MWPFTRRGGPKGGAQPHFPAGRVGYAVGDIHGRADLLAAMLGLIEEDLGPVSAEVAPVVVFLGDYVDRGPDSRGVLDRLLAWRPPVERRYLMGNHEQAMLAFLDDPPAMRAWLDHGGMDTLQSFGVRPPPPTAPDESLQDAAAALNAALGPERRAFLQALETLVVFGDYAFVHAGIDPDRSLEEQTPADLLWIRGRFISDARRSSHVIVHGHTPSERPHRDARRIGLDTGAYATGLLTAARFEGADVRFLHAGRKRLAVN